MADKVTSALRLSRILLDPLVVKSLLCCHPLSRILHQQTLEQPDTTCRKLESTDVWLVLQDAIEELFGFLASKGRSTVHEHIEYDPTRPHVTLLCVLFQNHLRGNVKRSPHPHAQCPFLWYPGCDSEVDDLYVLSTLLKEYVLRLQVAMHDALRMEVDQCLKELAHDDCDV